jgi:hypothetical protein
MSALIDDNGRYMRMKPAGQNPLGLFIRDMHMLRSWTKPIHFHVCTVSILFVCTFYPLNSNKVVILYTPEQGNSHGQFHDLLKKITHVDNFWTAATLSLK